MEKTVSIIIPNYNKGIYISQTLNSVINQVYPNWEAIVVDDGSTDNSLSIIKEYTEKDLRIKLIQRTSDKRGGSVCRNIGLKYAKGDYILFLDADDLLTRNCLLDRLAEIGRENDVDFIVSTIGTFKEKIGDNDYVWSVPKGNHLALFLSHKLPWHTMSPLWRKEFLEQLNGFNPDFPRLQDVEMHTRALMEKGVNYIVSKRKQPDAFYRIDEKRIKDYQSHLHQISEGAVLYIEYFSQYLKSKNIKGERFLRGTYLAIIRQILDLRQVRFISGALAKEEIHGFRLRTDKLVLNNWRTKFIFHGFLVGYRLWVNKVKGFNYFFSKMFLKI